VNIIVSGSIAYDRIMEFPGTFSDHIIPAKIDSLNVCFPVDTMLERFGGTAGNIAYALTLLGERPLISASVGRDHQRYFDWLRQNGISTQYINVVEDEMTACANITTDRAANQITVFHFGAMKHSAHLDFRRFDPRETLVIVSPGNMQDMTDYPRLCQAGGIPYIFDPGQQVTIFSADQLIQAITGARILICNDYEMELIVKKTGLSQNELLKLTETIIVTKGEQGSRVSLPGKDVEIPVARPQHVVDPTGAGDSYRGGLISGLVKGLSIEQSARLGSVCASFCLEHCGTQEYRFTAAEFNQRLDSLKRADQAVRS
jgi:adenosine kinase